MDLALTLPAPGFLNPNPPTVTFTAPPVPFTLFIVEHAETTPLPILPGLVLVGSGEAVATSAGSDTFAKCECSTRFREPLSCSYRHLLCENVSQGWLLERIRWRDGEKDEKGGIAIVGSLFHPHGADVGRAMWVTIA
jgi:hypothetical protein